MQDVDFPYEVIIYDDASTDGTSDIVREYAEKYPQIMKAIIAPKNTYHAQDRWKIILDLKRKYFRGQYIAHCEGDDLWIDRYKLRLQVEYMETHKECSMCLHNALWFDCENGKMRAGNHYLGSDELDVSGEEIIMQYKRHPPMASMLYRRELIERPYFFLEAPVGDYPTLLYALTKGKIHYSNRIMSLYRWQSNGSYSARVKADEYLLFHFNMGLLEFFIQYDQYTQYHYHNWCVNKIHLFASGIVYKIDSSRTIKEYMQYSKVHGYTFSEKCERYIEELERLRRQIFDMQYCSDDLKTFVGRYDKVYIMGAGEYGAIIARQFDNNHIDFEGFAVSEKNKADFYMGKPVWSLSNLPADKKNTGIVIGINPLRWDTILDALNKADIKNYYCPFLICLEECRTWSECE